MTAPTPYIPGGSPCAGACTLPWAVAQTGVTLPDIPASTFDLPAGTLITWMSYGKNGQPHGYASNLATAGPHIVSGWELPDGTMLVQFPECANWAVVQPTGTPLDAPAPMTSDLLALATSPVVVAQAHGVSGVAFWAGSGSGGYTGSTSDLTPPIEPPVAPVPVPATFGLLAVALVTATLILRFRHEAASGPAEPEARD